MLLDNNGDMYWNYMFSGYNGYFGNRVVDKPIVGGDGYLYSILSDAYSSV